MQTGRTPKHPLPSQKQFLCRHSVNTCNVLLEINSELTNKLISQEAFVSQLIDLEIDYFTEGFDSSLIISKIRQSCM